MRQHRRAPLGCQRRTRHCIRCRRRHCSGSKASLSVALPWSMVDTAFDRFDRVVERNTLQPGTEDRPEMSCTSAGTSHPHRKHGLKTLALKTLALAKGSPDIRRCIYGHIGVSECPDRGTQSLPLFPQRTHQTLEQNTAAKQDRLHAGCGCLEIVPKRPWLAGMQDVQAVTLHAPGALRLTRIQRAIKPRQHIGHACAWGRRGRTQVLRMSWAARHRRTAEVEERRGLRTPLARGRHMSGTRTPDSRASRGARHDLRTHADAAGRAGLSARPACVDARPR